MTHILNLMFTSVPDIYTHCSPSTMAECGCKIDPESCANRDNGELSSACIRCPEHKDLETQSKTYLDAHFSTCHKYPLRRVECGCKIEPDSSVDHGNGEICYRVIPCLEHDETKYTQSKTYQEMKRLCDGLDASKIFKDGPSKEDASWLIPTEEDRVKCAKILKEIERRL